MFYFDFLFRFLFFWSSLVFFIDDLTIYAVWFWFWPSSSRFSNLDFPGTAWCYNKPSIILAVSCCISTYFFIPQLKFFVHFLKWGWGSQLIHHRISIVTHKFMHMIATAINNFGRIRILIPITAPVIITLRVVTTGLTVEGTGTRTFVRIDRTWYGNRRGRRGDGPWWGGGGWYRQVLVCVCQKVHEKKGNRYRNNR